MKRWEGKGEERERKDFNNGQDCGVSTLQPTKRTRFEFPAISVLSSFS